MILSDNTIRRYVMRKVIEVEPWVPEHVQPAGLDLTLGYRFVRLQPFPPTHSAGLTPDDPYLFEGPMALDPRFPVVDPKRAVYPTERLKVEPGDVYMLPPGGFVLARTAERFTLPADVVGLLNGRSSLGRLGLFVHVTAGLFDPGWSGVGTLELYNAAPNPIALHPGMRIAQLVFQRMDQPAAKPYAGKYQGATGVQTSRIDRDWKGGDHAEG